MAKYKQGFFFQVSREPFKPTGHAFTGIPEAKINDLSLSAFKLYFWLHELEHRFTSGEIEGHKKKKGKQTDWFFRSDADLVSDTELSHGAISKAKKELVAEGFIQTWQMHWIVDVKTRKKSYKHVTAFRILI